MVMALSVIMLEVLLKWLSSVKKSEPEQMGSMLLEILPLPLEKVLLLVVQLLYRSHFMVDFCTMLGYKRALKLVLQSLKYLLDC